MNGKDDLLRHTKSRKATEEDGYISCTFCFVVEVKDKADAGDVLLYSTAPVACDEHCVLEAFGIRTQLTPTSGC